MNACGDVLRGAEDYREEFDYMQTYMICPLYIPVLNSSERRLSESVVHFGAGASPSNC